MKLPSLNIQILFAAIFGTLIGIFFHNFGVENDLVKGGLYASNIVGTLFIDLLKMILIPLVFCSISVGIANLRQHQQMHRVWVTTLLFFVVSMAIAIVIALVAGNYFKPGAGLHLAMFADAMHNFQAKQMPIGEFATQFLHGLFVNPFKALEIGRASCRERVSVLV